MRKIRIGLATLKHPKSVMDGVEWIEAMLRQAKRRKVALIVGLEWVTDNGLQNRAVVIGRSGRMLGHQTENQITPDTESRTLRARRTAKSFSRRWSEVRHRDLP